MDALTGTEGVEDQVDQIFIPREVFGFELDIYPESYGLESTFYTLPVTEIIEFIKNNCGRGYTVKEYEEGIIISILNPDE